MRNCWASDENARRSGITVGKVGANLRIMGESVSPDRSAWRPGRAVTLPGVIVLLIILSLSILSCGGHDTSVELPDWPVFVFAVDGLEWDVMLPMIEAGELPNVKRLMAEGTFGRLESMIPTLSPVIWTSVATGKSPENHGIRHFVKNWDAEGNERALYSNSDRNTKALWNIFSDYDKEIHTIGWWMTFPVEPVKGIMVAQANTREQIKTEGGRAIWKGTFIRGLKGQVWPLEEQDAIMALAESVDGEIERLKREVFGDSRESPSELAQRLWNNTTWAFRADTIYMKIARRILQDDPTFDMMMIYFGGPDVVGHRFWRYMYPGRFDHTPTEQETEAYSGIIRDYYRYVDSGIGTILDDCGVDATVFLVSDHGMHEANLDQTFDPDLPPVNVNSGDHQDGPAGVIVASGKFVKGGGENVDFEIPGSAADLPMIGKILDLAPTLLALKGIPIGSDMEGMILQNVLERSFLKNHSPRFIPTHDTDEWLASRPGRLYSPAAEEERIEQLRALGYLK